MSTTLELRHIRLRVSDLARSVDFYTRQLGFARVRSDATSADLATDAAATPILTLVGGADRGHARRNAAGFFHAALLFPERANLGAWLQFASERGVAFDGFSDHGVSEAIYFSDPDGNGLEFYADRSREEWPYADGELAMVTQPLDVRSLVAAGTASTIGNASSPLARARWGHLHLRVTNLDQSERFYRDALGLTVTQRSYPGARFLAADGYHHHLGLNTWGHPRGPALSAAPGLDAATFARRSAEQPRELSDPDGITLRLVPLVGEPASAAIGAIRDSL